MKSKVKHFKSTRQTLLKNTRPASSKININISTEISKGKIQTSVNDSNYTKATTQTNQQKNKNHPLQLLNNVSVNSPQQNLFETSWTGSKVSLNTHQNSKSYLFNDYYNLFKESYQNLSKNLTKRTSKPYTSKALKSSFEMKNTLNFGKQTSRQQLSPQIQDQWAHCSFLSHYEHPMHSPKPNCSPLYSPQRAPLNNRENYISPKKEIILYDPKEFIQITKVNIWHRRDFAGQMELQQENVIQSEGGNGNKSLSKERGRDFCSQICTLPGPHHRPLEEKMLIQSGRKVTPMNKNIHESYYFNPKDGQKSSVSKDKYPTYSKQVKEINISRKKTNEPMKKFLYETSADFLVSHQYK